MQFQTHNHFASQEFGLQMCTAIARLFKKMTVCVNLVALIASSCCTLIITIYDGFTTSDRNPVTMKQ